MDRTSTAFLNLQGLLNAPNAWPEKLTAWASSADVFRRPERLEAMAYLVSSCLPTKAKPPLKSFMRDGANG